MGESCWAGSGSFHRVQPHPSPPLCLRHKGESTPLPLRAQPGWGGWEGVAGRAVDHSIANSLTPPQPSPVPPAQGREHAPPFAGAARRGRLGGGCWVGSGSFIREQPHPSPALPCAFGTRKGAHPSPCERSPEGEVGRGLPGGQVHSIAYSLTPPQPPLCLRHKGGSTPLPLPAQPGGGGWEGVAGRARRIIPSRTASPLPNPPLRLRHKGGSTGALPAPAAPRGADHSMPHAVAAFVLGSVQRAIGR